MIFTLCYKDYDIKMSIGAIKAFKETTGKCLWSTAIEYIYVFEQSRSDKDNLMLTISKLGKILDFLDSSEFLYALSKPCNSQVSLAEIQDGMFHVGMLPTEIEGEKFEPYQMVILKVCIDIQESMKELIVEKKSQAN